MNNEDFINKLEVIRRKVKEELNISHKFYLECIDEEFQNEDYYNKYVLFTLYRAIEDLVKLLIDERKINSNGKDLYNLLQSYLKSNFIDPQLLKIILEEVYALNNINYEMVYSYIVNNEVSSFTSIINNVNKIKPNNCNKTTLVSFEILSSNFSACRNNRNTLLHSVVIEKVDLSKRSIIEALFVYSYFMVLFNLLFVIPKDEENATE